MFRINQRFTAFNGCQFLLGVCIATVSTVVPIFSSPRAISQTVVDTLPTPQLEKSNQPPRVEEVFVPRDLDFRVPEPSITQKFDSYLVYVDDPNPTQLEQIKQTIPTAFRRQHQGKTVIQAGVFSNQLNAIILAQKLQSFGITSHIFNLTTVKEVAVNTDKSKFYSVVVPTIVENNLRFNR